MALGISFVPGEAPEQQQQQTGGPPLQQALQLLSLRMPRFGGVNALAPDQLLQGQGGGTGPVPGTPEWEALMRRLMMQGQSPQTPMGPVFTNPRVRPGESRPPGDGMTKIPTGDRAPDAFSPRPPRFPTIGQYPGSVPIAPGQPTNPFNPDRY